MHFLETDRVYKVVIITFIVVFIFTWALMWLDTIWKSTEADTSTEETQHSTLVLETVAHIPATEFPDYTRVWQDTSTDRAVYVRNNYIPTPICEQGDIVFFSEMQCQVISTDEQGIILQLPDGVLAQYGMSGSIVTYSGQPVALISKATSMNTVYAVYM